MKDVEAWLHRLATDPLPGGVAAAALSAAMGAALISKAIRVTLAQQDIVPAVRAEIEAILALARTQQAELMERVDADERAYREVLAVRKHGVQDPGLIAAWQAATAVPIEIAEICRSLLEQVPRLLEISWPPVRVDLQIGESLLRAGVHAGFLAAENNLRTWGDSDQARSLWLRIDVLREAKI